MTAWLLTLLACSSDPPAPQVPAEVPPAASTAAPQEVGAAAPAAIPTATEARVEGWGAVLAKDGTWFRTSGGDLAAGAKGVVGLAPTGQQGACGEIIAEPAGGMIVLPEGVAAPTVTPAPPILASLVERAAWRLDELLPEADPYTPAATSLDPARSRGVELGSVAKVRRELAPPVLIAAGHRGCTGVVAVLSADAGQTLVQHTLADACEPLRVLPPTDLDGDGHREVAAWSRSRAALYRFVEGPGDPGLVLLADWTCR